MTIVGRGLGLTDYGSVVLSGLGSNIVSGVVWVAVCEYVSVVQTLVAVGVEEHNITVSVLDNPMEVAVVEFTFDIELVTVDQVIDALEC